MVKSEFDDCFQNGNYDALRPYHVDNAIILAAGMCSRFKPLSDTKPKAFLKVKGEILIERMIRQLIEALEAGEEPAAEEDAQPGRHGGGGGRENHGNGGDAGR